MPKEVVMPRLSDTMSEGTVSKWRKQLGEPIRKGEIIAEIETDKATQDLESYDEGVLSQILVQEGTTVPLGTPIAIIAAPGEGAPPAPAAPVAEAPAPAAPPVPAEAPAPSVTAPAPAPEAEEERLKVSPIARRVAQEHGLDVRQIAGTGPGGRIVKEDVERALKTREAAAAAPPAAPQAPAAPPVPATPAAPVAPPAPAAPSAAAEEEMEIFQLNRMQQAIARRMLQSTTEAPYFYTTSEIDMTAAAVFRRQLNEGAAGQPSISFNDMVLKAVALALRSFPTVNASWDNGQLRINKRINVGFAVAMPEEKGPGGLIVPVIHDADQKSLRQISSETRALIEKARAGRLAERDLSGGTFNISNMGMFDVDHFTAIINPPNSAILAIGSIAKKPAVKNDEIVIADRMRVTLTSDHRVIYGLTAAQFLQELKRILENPLTLV